MRYMGSKSRIAKDIATQINHFTQGVKPFVSLFCGSCVIESKVDSPMKILNDKHPYLIAMWKGLQQGYELPETVTREQYYEIKNNLDKDPALSGFVGFGCSFGGKWFGGYAKDSNGTNYALQSKKSVLKDFAPLSTATFTNLDYRDVEIPEGAVIYADPPYEGTTGYVTGEFDHREFWEYVRKLSRNHIVLVSEQSAPSDFFTRWEKSFTRTLDVNKKNQPKKIEKLFIHYTHWLDELLEVTA